MTLKYKIFGIPGNVEEVVDAVGNTVNTVQVSLDRDLGSPSFLEGFMAGTLLEPCVKIVSGKDKYSLTSKDVETVRGYATQITEELSKKGVDYNFTDANRDIKRGFLVM